jgi:serine/threonine protein kinase
VTDSTTSNLLRSTIVQAFAQTMADPSHRSGAAPTRRSGSGEEVDVDFGDDDAIPVTFELPDVGDVVGEHYKLVRLLGKGMFGKVYVAQRVDVPEHQVALKLLPRSLYAGRNVERELVMLATVGHPNVVQLKDHGTTPDYVWLTMPVYQGETLAERLEKKGTLSCRQAYDIFLPVARGLEALHAAGLRHQDVKPENIFLAVFGGRVHPILLDLGVAAEKDAAFVAGTALYGAPEQVSVLSGLPIIEPLSEKMDTYGLAATLLMALVGPQEFPGEKAINRTELSEAQEVRTTKPISNAALTDVTGDPRDQIAACFKSWLSFSSEDRPTMKELAEQLEVLLEPDAEEVRREERRRARQQRTFLWFKIILAAMLLIGAAGGILVYNQRETLRIASDLERARVVGAKSFDQLGTCNAAHQADTKALTDCRTASDKERADFNKQLDDVMKSGSTSQAEKAHEAQRYLNKLKSCDEGATAQKKTCDEASARLTAEKATLATERDEAKKLADSEKAQIAARESERDQCKAERLACFEERDALKASAAARPAGPGARPASPGGAVAPAATGAPTAESPAPAPAPAPPSPAPAPAPAPAANP